MADSPSQPDKLIAFFRKGRKRVYKKGEIILYAGDTPQGIYLIESGRVKIYSLSKEGAEHTHLFYRDGDIFPLIWAFKDAIRNVYYQALDTVTVWVIPKDEFTRFVNSDADVAVTLLKQAVEMFRLYAGRIDNLLYSNSFERTVYRLFSLANRFGEKENGHWTIQLPVTHQDIASSVNLSRETVSRALERLQRKGIISYDKQHCLVIEDMPAMAQIIGKDEVVSMWPQFEEHIA